MYQSYRILILDSASVDLMRVVNALKTEFCIEFATNGKAGLAIARAIPVPDLVVICMDMPDFNGFTVYAQLKQFPHSMGISTIFTSEDEGHEPFALSLENADFIKKPYSIQTLRARIQNCLRSAKALIQGEPQKQLNPGEPVSIGNGNACLSSLTKRESEILALVVQGLTSVEISKLLFIAKGTVAVHRENIVRKLGVHSVAGLVKYAYAAGMVIP